MSDGLTPRKLRAHSGRGKRRLNAKRATSGRKPRLEPLEARCLLSVNLGTPIEQLDVVADTAVQAEPAKLFDTMWYVAEDESAPPITEFEEFTALEVWPDFDPTQDGIQLTYSYSNFLDGGLPGGLTPEDLKAATEEALGLWASEAPLHFQEIEDSGPIPTDVDYGQTGHPHLRIGHHFIDGSSGSNVLAHAYFPVRSDGLAGDVHFDNSNTWALVQGSGAFDVIEVMLHELGHSLGLGHEITNDAIMNPFIQGRFNGLGSGFLLQDDINGIHDLYGPGVGSVTPLAPFVVDTIVDVDDGDFSEGNFSLREAIGEALLVGGGQKIIFAEALIDQTIVLGSSLPISGSLVIEGLGSDQLTIQATDPTPGIFNGDGFEIFTITDDDSENVAEVKISGVTLTGGDSATAGGAISSEEKLSLKDVSIHDNASALSGGGIFSAGGISIEESTISGNSSGDEGGGVAAVGDGTEIVFLSSTISGNTSVGDGGGLHFADLNPTKLRLEHSTVTQNIAGGTGGGVYELNGVLVLDHSIVAGNTDAGGAPDIDNINLFASPVVLILHSLVGISAGANLSPIDGEQIGTVGDPLDAMLGPLVENGGTTKTHLPQVGSPVIDSGNDDILFPPDFDQRGLGFDRIVAGRIDIGAVESTGFTVTYKVDTLVDEIDSDYTTGNFSLREAIALAGGSAGTDQIIFDESLSGGVILLDSGLGELVISSSISINAVDLPVVMTIDASATDPTPLVKNGDGTRVFRVDDGSAVTQIEVVIEGLTLTGGDVSGDGGAIHSMENLTLQTVSILDNSAADNGGGIYHKTGSLVVENSTVANNQADDDGGGLYSDTSKTGSLTGRVSSSTFSGNVAGDEGGGIFNFDGALALEYATITNNQALKGGGVVSFGDLFTETSVMSTIIAGNIGLDVEKSRNLAHNSFNSLGYNLIGIGNAIFNFDIDPMFPDLVEVLDPQLGTLSNNGGRTLTHLPAEGSPAIDAGDPALIAPGADMPEFDQRGKDFSRLGDGDDNGSSIIDIGAVEVPTLVPDADFDDDSDVDGFDFLAWQLGLGTTSGATNADGDANGDGDVDGDDLLGWEATFGTTGPAPSTAITSSEPSLESASSSADVVALAARHSLFSQHGIRPTDNGLFGGDEGRWTRFVSPAMSESATPSDQADNESSTSRPALKVQAAVHKKLKSLDEAFEQLESFRLRGGL